MLLVNKQRKLIRLALLAGLIGSLAFAVAQADEFDLEARKYQLFYVNDPAPYFAKSFLSESVLFPPMHDSAQAEPVLEQAEQLIAEGQYASARLKLASLSGLYTHRQIARHAFFLLFEIDRLEGRLDAAYEGFNYLLQNPAYGYLNNLVFSRLADIELQRKHPEQALQILAGLKSNLYAFSEGMLIKAMAFLQAGQAEQAVESLQALHFNERSREALRQLCLGEAYYFSGRYAQALPAYEQAGSLSSAASITLVAAFGGVMSEYHVRSAVDAQKALESFLARYPESPYQSAVIYHLALVKEKLGQNLEAARLMEQLKNDELSQASLYGALRNMYRAGDMAETSRLARRFRNKFMQSSYLDNVLVYEAQSLMAQGQYEQAGQVYDILAKQFPQRTDLSKIIFNSGYAYNKARQYQKAVAAFERFQTLHADLDDLFRNATILKAEALYQLQHYAYAIDVYRQAYGLTQEPAVRQQTLYGTGWCYFKMRQFENAIQQFLQAIAIDPQSRFVETAWFKVAESHMRLGNVLEARLVYEDIESRYPAARRKAAYQKAMMYYQIEDFAEGQKLFNNYLASFPKDERVPEALYWIGWTHYRQNHTQDAVATFARLKTEFGQTRYGREADFRIADSYFYGKQWREAETAYRQALVYDDWAEDAYYGLVQSLLKQNRVSDARDTLEQYARTFPDAVLLKELKNTLNTIPSSQAISTGGPESAS